MNVLARQLIVIALSSACSDPGWISGPISGDPIRTASYRVGVADNRPELLLFLSSSWFDGCTLPNLEDEILQAQVGSPVLLEMCREGAQHVMVSAYAPDGTWTGRFPHDPELAPQSVGVSIPRGAKARYFGVEEAFRLRFSEHLEGYAASDYVNLDPLPTRGVIEMEQRGAEIRGTFALHGVTADFVAQPCPGDTSLLETLQDVWVEAFCDIRID